MDRDLYLFAYDFTGKSLAHWANPATERIEPKVVYVERVGDILLGCGIYKN